MTAELWLMKPCAEHGSVFRHQTDDGKWCYPKMSRRLDPDKTVLFSWGNRTPITVQDVIDALKEE